MKSNAKVLIAVAVLVVIALGWYVFTRRSGAANLVDLVDQFPQAEHRSNSTPLESAFEIGTLRQLDGSPAPSMGMAPSFNAATVPPNQGPRASFTVRSHRLLARFDATTSSDRDGRIARYDWDFGDGTTLPDGGPRPSHVYRDTGSHRVTLVVTDNEGCSSSLVFTGRSALCTGGPAARTTRLVR